MLCYEVQKNKLELRVLMVKVAINYISKIKINIIHYINAK